MTTNFKLMRILDCQPMSLGEGLYYCHIEDILYWVDIHQAKLFIYHSNSNSHQQHQFDETISWVNKTNNGKLIIGLRSGVYFYDVASRQCSLVWQNPYCDSGQRLNDAKTDREGHLYFGTMDDDERSPVGQLFQLVKMNLASPIDNNYIISNGPAFNVEGNVLYSVSSSERTIFRITNFKHRINPNKSIFLTFPPEYGYPDGITVDSEDNVWVASWGGGLILCFSNSAKLLAKIRIPAPYVTNIIFAGHDLKDVYVTTATSPMSDKEKRCFPNAGKIFKFRATIPGIAPHLVDI